MCLGGSRVPITNGSKSKRRNAFKPFENTCAFGTTSFHGSDTKKWQPIFHRSFNRANSDAESSYCILNNIEASESIMDHIMDIAHSIRIKLV